MTQRLDGLFERGARSRRHSREISRLQRVRPGGPVERFRGRPDADQLVAAARALRRRVEPPDRIDLVSPEFDACGVGVGGGPQVDDAATPGQCAGLEHLGLGPVSRLDGTPDQIVRAQPVPRRHRERRRPELCRRERALR